MDKVRRAQKESLAIDLHEFQIYEHQTNKNQILTRSHTIHTYQITLLARSKYKLCTLQINVFDILQALICF